MHSYNLHIFELDVAFKTEAHPARVENASAYVDKIYADLKLHGAHLGRDRLLSILALGVADDLLQLKEQYTLLEEKMEQLIQSINSALPLAETSSTFFSQ